MIWKFPVCVNAKTMYLDLGHWALGRQTAEAQESAAADFEHPQRAQTGRIGNKKGEFIFK
jgi:hypothetical protein